MDPLHFDVFDSFALSQCEIFTCFVWTTFSTQELWDLYHVLCLHMHGDILASHVSELLKQRYPWQELYNALPVVKQMWYTFVKKDVPWPVAVLRAGDCVNKHLAGS